MDWEETLKRDGIYFVSFSSIFPASEQQKDEMSMRWTIDYAAFYQCLHEKGQYDILLMKSRKPMTLC